MTVTFRKCTQEDMAFVRVNPFEIAIKGYHFMEAPEDNTFTAIYESSIVGIGGLVVMWKGVGMVWLMLTAQCEKQGVHGLIAIEAIQEKMEELLKDNNIRRVECVVRTDFPQAKKMIEHFGFRQVGLMEQYCPDLGDVWMYERINK